MQQSSPRTQRKAPIGRSEQRRPQWDGKADGGDRPPRPTGPRLIVPAREPAAVGGEWQPLHDQVLAGARALAGQMRALQERYQEEHRRLADTLEFLSIQGGDLERQLSAFGELADQLEPGYLAEPLPTRSAIGLIGAEELSPAAGLEVRCLGGFDVQYHGRPVDLGSSRNGRAIFKYLLCCAAGRRASKELLADLFWPEVGLEQALPSVQSAIYQLRRAAGADEPELAASPLIVFQDDQYCLNPQLGLTCDVDRFRRQVLEARLCEARADPAAACQAYQRALRVYAGELLPEERYREWAIVERTALEADRIDLLARLTRLTMQRGAYAESVQYGRLLLQADPTREDIHRDIMRCLSRLGRRGEALRQHQHCRDALVSELDLEPEPETSELFGRLVRGEAM